MNEPAEEPAPATHDADSAPPEPSAAEFRASTVSNRMSPGDDEPAKAANLRRAERQPWSEFVPLLRFTALFLASGVLAFGYAFATGDASPWIDVTVTSFDCCLVLAFGWTMRTELRKQFGIGTAGRRAWLRGGLAFLACGLAAEAWFFLARFAFEMLPVLDSFRDHDWPMWSAFVLIVVTPPLVEEVAFRGILLTRLSPLLGTRDALLLQATLFSIAHLSPAILPSHFALGLGLGLVRLYTGSLWPGIALHAAWNLRVVLQEGLLA